MTALSADTQRVLQSGRDSAPISPQVLINVTIYHGSACMALAASHYARPVTIGATAPQFLGFSEEQKAGGTVQAAAPTCKIVQQGKLQIPNTTAYFAAGALVTGDIGKPVYMGDDGTAFTLTEGSAGTLAVGIGKIDNIDLINGVVTIAFQSHAMRSI